MSARYAEAVRALIDEIATIRRPVLCPVSELTGEAHHFIPGTGRVVEWDVMGDSRHTVEVCQSCADVTE